MVFLSYPFAILLLMYGMRVVSDAVGCYFECVADG